MNETPEEYEHDLKRLNEIDQIKVKFDELYDSLNEFSERWMYYNNFELETIKKEFMRKCSEVSPFQMNLFEYNDVYYDRCGDSGGSETVVLTWHSDEEVKRLMWEYINKLNGKKYCPHEFLATVPGIKADGRTSTNLSDNTDKLECHTLSRNGHKDCLTSEEYAEYERKVKERDRILAEAEKAKQLAAVEAREKAEFERLKAKWEAKT